MLKNLLPIRFIMSKRFNERLRICYLYNLSDVRFLGVPDKGKSAKVLRTHEII